MVHYRIKEICSEKGITQKELAAKVELSSTSLSQIVTGKQKPSLDTLEKIASALDVGISTCSGIVLRVMQTQSFVPTAASA